MNPVLQRWLTILVTLAALAALGLVVYPWRFKIEAKIWHWRHGYSTRVEQYQVPVPAAWLVTDSDDPDWVDLVDVSGKRRGVITLMSHRTTIGDVSRWKSVKEEWLAREGVRDLEERDVSFANGILSCVGGSELRDAERLPTNLVSLECETPGTLGLMFVGPRSGIPEFYAIASKIQALQ